MLTKFASRNFNCLVIFQTSVLPNFDIYITYLVQVDFDGSGDELIAGFLKQPLYE